MLICIQVSRHAHDIARDLLSKSVIGRTDLAAYPSYFLIPGITTPKNASRGKNRSNLFITNYYLVSITDENNMGAKGKIAMVMRFRDGNDWQLLQ